MKTQIQIKLFATLRQLAPTVGESLTIETGTTVAELLTQLRIPEEKAKLIFINGRKGRLSSVLSGGERVGLFPPVGGG